MTGDGTIVVFVRLPRRGRIKTRLSPALGPDDIVGLYRAFVEDGLETATRTGFPVTVAFTPAAAADEIRTWLGDAHRYRPQRGPDLGRRMATALEAAYAEGFRWALIVGSDLPDLPVACLAEAVHAVAHTGAVLGPSTDGGYYLIGFRADRFVSAAFRDVDWGGHAVAAQTLASLHAAGQTVHRLPPWRDVDTPDDLNRLRQRLLAHPGRASRTRDWLRREGLL